MRLVAAISIALVTVASTSPSHGQEKASAAVKRGVAQHIISDRADDAIAKLDALLEFSDRSTVVTRLECVDIGVLNIRYGAEREDRPYNRSLGRCNTAGQKQHEQRQYVQ